MFDAAIDAYADSGKPFVPISGVWVYGNNTDITEASPENAPALVAWKEPLQRRLFSQTGMRGVVITSSVAYGDGGGGMPGIILGSPRDAAGNLIMLGTGQQHWSTVHVADLAEPFGASSKTTPHAGVYVIGNGLNPTVAELTEAAAVAVGAPGAVPGSDEEARARARGLVGGSPPPRPGNPGPQGSRRTRLGADPRRTRRGVPDGQLPEVAPAAAEPPLR